MKAKKWLALLLSGAMALTVGVMAACNNDDNNDDNEGGNEHTHIDADNNGKCDVCDEEMGTVDGGGDHDYTLDTTEYYLVGDGGGDLKQNGWSNTNHVLTLVRDEEADHNVFKITVDLYAGDAFQIIHDDSWDGQMGITYFLDVTEDGEVLNADNEVVFKGAGMFGSDIELQPGHDGTYEIALHTFPDGEQEVYITWEKTGELAALLDMYVVSDMNDFGFAQAAYAASHMEKNGSIWKYMLTIEESDLKRDAEGELVSTGAEYAAVAVRNDVADVDGYKVVTSDATREPLTFIDGDEYNLLPAGVYTLTYNADNGVLTIAEGAFQLYFVGSFNEWSASEEYSLTDNNDGTWSGYLTLTEAAEAKLHNPLSNGWYTANSDDSNMMLEAGEYYFKFTVETTTVEYEKLGYYVVGTFIDGEGNSQNFTIVKGVTPELALTADGVYEAEYTVQDVTGHGDYSWVVTEGPAGSIFALKVVYGSVLGGVKDGCWYGVGADGSNYYVTEAGEYVISFNAETLEITVAPVALEYTVTFDLNYEGAEGAPEAQTVQRGEAVVEPADPAREDYTFLGWYTDEACTLKYEFGTPVTADITLYARWILTSEIPAAVEVTFELNYTGAPAAEVKATDNGLVVKPENPVREGYYFTGWYTAANGGTLFNFDEIISESTTVYAQWHEVDTHVYHIVGSLKNGLVGSWEADNLGLTLVHDENHPAENVFKIEVMLFAGDEFKILGVTSWGQPEINGGNLKGDKNQLAGEGTSNIQVKISGTYVLYLNTDKNNELTWTCEELTSANEIYFKVNGVEGAKLGLGGDGNWMGSITVQAGDVVKLIDKFDGNKEYATDITEAGEYMVKFVTETSTVETEKLTYWVVGTFIDATGAAKNFMVIDGLTPKLTLGTDGKYTATFDVTDITYHSDFSWVKNEGGANAIFAIQVIYGSAMGGVKDWVGGGNTWVTEGAGSYTVTFDATARLTTLTKNA